MKYPRLFEPVRTGSITFRNRILASATGHLDIGGDKRLSEGALLYYERKAIGGAAAVCVGECNVDPANGSRGGLTIDMTDFWSVGYLGRLADYIQRNGAVASAELQHAGRYSTTGYGPSDGTVDGRPVHAMNEEQIEAALAAYANGAFMAKMAGFKMVTVHGGHGWLPQQFFSTFTNDRKDRWGGSSENRARFAVALIDRIHEKCGRDFPVEMRISGTELMDGYGLEDGIQYAMALDGHADIIHVSVGVHGSLSRDHWLNMSPTMFMQEGVNVKYAAEVKKHVRNSLVAAVGSLSDPDMMEEILETGKADFVAIARQLLADPDLPNKARSGREGDIRQCIRCMSCWSNLMSGGIYCAINPETSRERESKFALRPARPRKVLVAGGGIAGMQAALTAAENGHDVILCEKTGTLGGGIRVEKDVPFKKRVEGFIRHMEKRLSASTVDVRMNAQADENLVEQENPDVVIAAIGAEPIVPSIEGIGKAVPASIAYQNPDDLSSSVIIIGAGLIGAELAIYLHDRGHSIQIAEAGPAIHSPENGTQGLAVSGELSRRGIVLRTLTAAKQITPEGLVCSTPEGEVLLEGGSIVYATGLRSKNLEAYALGKNAPAVYVIGDADAPGTIMTAVKTAYTVARNIGRYDGTLMFNPSIQ